MYEYTGGEYKGGHAVKLIGWGSYDGVDYWLAANSWNSDWGDNGNNSSILMLLLLLLLLFACLFVFVRYIDIDNTVSVSLKHNLKPIYKRDPDFITVKIRLSYGQNFPCA